MAMTLPSSWIGGAAAGLAALVLAGCLPAENPVTFRSSELYVTDTYNQAHDFRFQNASTNFEARELTRLDSFLSRAGIGADDLVSVSAYGQLAAARQTIVLDALGARGVTARVVGGRLTGPDAVTLLIERPQNLAGRCRPRDLRPTIEGLNLQLPGCANDHNLARMVVDQNDLIEGKPLGPADGEALSRGIEEYRAGEIEPLKEESTTDN
ncbi:MAG: CpaD family pilus assembly lipoprotein [Pseudomonadota bacterium]